MYVLGVSCFYHDAAACLLRDGEPVAAAREESFSRRKHDPRFPIRAIRWALSEAGIEPSDLQAVAFYEDPALKQERIRRSQVETLPRSLPRLVRSAPAWLKPDRRFAQAVAEHLGPDLRILYGRHHLSHAASTFFASGWDEASILTVDGVGEWATASWGVGRDRSIEQLGEIRFPHSIGLLYSAFTDYLGFKVNSGEYKVMGLAPYGEPRYVDRIERLLRERADGWFDLDMQYFTYHVRDRMYGKAFEALLGEPARSRESELTQFHMDVARSLQAVLDRTMVRLATRVVEETGLPRLCMAGGVALNCVSNGHIIREAPVDALFVQPDAGDGGGAMGAALWAWHMVDDQPRRWRMGHVFLGPGYDDARIEADLKRLGAVFTRFERPALLERAAELLDEGNVVGWYQGRLEWGPRALGNRSILGDPRRPDMRDVINRKIKFREGFRPFAPSVLAHHAGDWFDLDRTSPYMLLVAPVHADIDPPLPAITHVDGSARIQTVERDFNPLYFDLIEAFRARTGCPVVINTSMNVRGEPIVNTPEDVWQCFMRTDMDALVCGPFVLLKGDQPAVELPSARDAFGLD